MFLQSKNSVFQIHIYSRYWIIFWLFFLVGILFSHWCNFIKYIWACICRFEVSEAGGIGASPPLPQPSSTPHNPSIPPIPLPHYLDYPQPSHSIHHLLCNYFQVQLKVSFEMIKCALKVIKSLECPFWNVCIVLSLSRGNAVNIYTVIFV